MDYFLKEREATLIEYFSVHHDKDGQGDTQAGLVGFKEAKISSTDTVLSQFHSILSRNSSWKNSQ